MGIIYVVAANRAAWLCSIVACLLSHRRMRRRFSRQDYRRARPRLASGRMVVLWDYVVSRAFTRSGASKISRDKSSRKSGIDAPSLVCNRDPRITTITTTRMNVFRLSCWRSAGNDRIWPEP